MNTFLAHNWLRLAGMAGLIGLSGFFSASETALFSLRPEDIEALERRHRRAGGAVRRLLTRPDDVLVSVLFGNLVVNTLFFSIGAMLSFDAAASFGTFVGSAFGAFVLIALLLFGEIFPKAIAVASPKAFAFIASLPLEAFHAWIGRPAAIFASPVLALVKLLAGRHPPSERLEPGELRMLVELAERSGELSGAEAEIFDGAVALSELRAREVMVPRVDVVCASVNEAPEQVLKKLRAHARSRAPVYEGPQDNVIGVVEAKDLIASCAVPGSGRCDLRALVKPVVFVPESARLESLLERVRLSGLEVAVVVDEYGGMAGLITLEDIAFSAFGDTAPASESGRPPVERTGPDSYLLAGDLSIRDWARLFDVEPEPGQFDTLGGFLAYLLGRIPKVGDAVQWEGLRFLVKEMRGRRVARVEIAPAKVGEGKRS